MAKISTKQSLRKREHKATSSARSALRGTNFNISKITLGLFIVGGFFIVLTFSWFYGITPWVAKYIECGEAPAVNIGSFEGPDLIFYPGDKEYGPHMLSTYTCMTPEEKSGDKHRIPNYPY